MPDPLIDNFVPDIYYVFINRKKEAVMLQLALSRASCGQGIKATRRMFWPTPGSFQRVSRTLNYYRTFKEQPTSQKKVYDVAIPRLSELARDLMDGKISTEEYAQKYRWECIKDYIGGFIVGSILGIIILAPLTPLVDSRFPPKE